NPMECDTNNPSKTVNFRIEPTASEIADSHAYLLMQIRSVDSSGGAHRVKVNGTNINDNRVPDLPPAPGNSQAWLLWMLSFPASLLNIGNNTLEIERASNDNFEVGDVVINWREE
ncbi:MAG: hypothetical protein ETSY2_22080, partial [Candidatus Entotheonella gemina]